MSDPITLDIALFRVTFPEFASVQTFPDAAIQAQFDLACGYISNENCGDLQGSKRAYALMLCTAHLLRIVRVIAQGADGAGSTGVVLQSTIDKISVMLQAPPSKDMFGFFFSQTPYGQQLLTYLSMQAAGGFLAGAPCIPERSAFRRAGGVF